jgi:hypothetical protein
LGCRSDNSRCFIVILRDKTQCDSVFQGRFAFLLQRIILIERDHGTKHSQQDRALKPRTSNVPPKKKSVAVAMKAVGPKNLARTAKKSANRKDPPAAIAEAPTNLPAVTLADAARYLSCFLFPVALSFSCLSFSRSLSWRSLVLLLVLLAFSSLSVMPSVLSSVGSLFLSVSLASRTLFLVVVKYRTWCTNIVDFGSRSVGGHYARRDSLGRADERQHGHWFGHGGGCH